MLWRRSASSPCFILLRKWSAIFRNASLLLLLCSSSSLSSPWLSKHSEQSELRTFWTFFSSFFTKVTMFSSSSWNRILCASLNSLSWSHISDPSMLTDSPLVCKVQHGDYCDQTGCKSICCSCTDHKYGVQLCLMLLDRRILWNLWALLVDSVEESWRISSHCVYPLSDKQKLKGLWVKVLITSLNQMPSKCWLYCWSHCESTVKQFLILWTATHS